MRLHMPSSILGQFNPLFIKNYHGWHSVAFSIGVHLIVLSFFPALLMDLSFKKFNEKKKIIHMFEVAKKPEALPLVEPKIETKSKPIQKEQILTQPVKRADAPIEPKDISPAQAVPQPASAMVKPLAYAVPIVEAQARSFPVSASDSIAPHAAHTSARMVTGYSGKLDAVAGQFQPRSISEISDNAIATTSRRTTTSSLAPDLFAAKPLSPSMIEETQMPKEDLQGIENGFATLIRERIASAKTYPSTARQAGHEGKVLVAFVLDKDGHVVDLSVQRTSSHARLDDAALEAVKKASPFPPIPEKLRRDSMSFKLPISFNLK